MIEAESAIAHEKAEVVMLRREKIRKASGNPPIAFKVHESGGSGGKSPEVHFQKPSPYFRKLIEFEV